VPHLTLILYDFIILFSSNKTADEPPFAFRPLSGAAAAGRKACAGKRRSHCCAGIMKMPDGCNATVRHPSM
jgi:hypothetical protein